MEVLINIPRAFMKDIRYYYFFMKNYELYVLKIKLFDLFND